MYEKAELDRIILQHSVENIANIAYNVISMQKRVLTDSLLSD